MALTLRQLAYFVALADTRNFGHAAARVHVTQPALSMQIREMEAALGTPLLERLPRDIRLTPAGREVLERARRVLAEVEEMEHAARRGAGGRRIRLGLIPTVAPYLLPRALARLGGSAADASDAAIGAELRVREAQTAVLTEQLDNGQLDAIVIAAASSSGTGSGAGPGRGPGSGSGTGGAPQPAGPVLGRRHIAVPLAEDRFLLAGSPARLAALPDREALRPAGLEPEHLLLLDEGHCLADQALEVCALDRRALRLDLGASSLSTLCGLVAGGHGLTFLPELALASETAAAPGMALVRFAAPEPARRLVLLRRAGTPESGWFAALAGILRQSAAGLIAEARQALPVPLPGAGPGAGPGSGTAPQSAGISRPG